MLAILSKFRVIEFRQCVVNNVFEQNFQEVRSQGYACMVRCSSCFFFLSTPLYYRIIKGDSKTNLLNRKPNDNPNYYLKFPISTSSISR